MDLRYGIGGIVVSLAGEQTVQCDNLGTFPKFHTEAPPCVEFTVRYGAIPSVEVSKPTFSSEGSWTLYRTDKGWQVALRSPVLGDEPHQLGTFASDFRSGILDILPWTDSVGHVHQTFPLAYPMGEILIINLLSQGLGVLVHGCGVAIGEDQGILFSGTSGAGKSTIASIWAKQPGVEVLSDDRVIIRCDGDGLWMYGTPFHGTAGYASPRAIPLKNIFFLEHAKRNVIRPVTPTEAIAQLLVRSFPPFWDREGMDFTLQALERLSQSIECYDLEFVPDTSVISIVLDNLHSTNHS